jgi:hypothetical protein
VVSALAFGGLQLIPVNFSYPEFAALIFVAGAGMGLFSAPNAAAIMNSVPARQRGAASGMLATFQNAGFVLSIGVFFSLMIAGLAASLPSTLSGGLTAQGVPHAIAQHIGALPPVGSLFAAFLGYNPIRELLTPTGVLAHLRAAHVALLTGKTFFPQLISQPFHHGLVIVFSMAMGLLFVAAGASALRGGRFVYEDQLEGAPAAASTSPAGANGQPTADAQPATSAQAAADEAAAPDTNAAASQIARDTNAAASQTAADTNAAANGHPAPDGAAARAMRRSADPGEPPR